MFEALTLERFLNYASRYNQDLYPVQYIMLALGITAVVMALFQSGWSSRFIAAILALLYAWISVLFYLVYFRNFMPLHTVFAFLFMLQAGIFMYEGVYRKRIVFLFRPDVYGLAGGLLILYGIFGYQAIEYLLGRGYPQILSFGLFPCPTVIFSLGILLWTEKKFPAYILIFPVLNALSGFLPAFMIGIIEDIGLIISGLTILILLKFRDNYLIFNK